MTTETHEEIYHWTINGLLKKLDARDDLIILLRQEIAQLRKQLEHKGEENSEHNA